MRSSPQSSLDQSLRQTLQPHESAGSWPAPGASAFRPITMPVPFPFELWHAELLAQDWLNALSPSIRERLSLKNDTSSDETRSAHSDTEGQDEERKKNEERKKEEKIKEDVFQFYKNLKLDVTSAEFIPTIFVPKKTDRQKKKGACRCDTVALKNRGNR